MGDYLWSKQREILESLVAHRYTAVHSCHDSGKSFNASRAVSWWLSVHPPGSAFAVTTAPTWPQVKAILWREIIKAHNSGKLDGRITLDCEWYMGQTDRGLERELVAYGRKPADYDQAAFQGIHAQYVLVIIDEACGVPKTLFDAVDTLVTNEAARVLAIGNPDDPATQFAEVCKPGSGWNVIHIPYSDTPNFTGEDVPTELADQLISRTWVEERKKRWGEESPLYVSKVLGEFPEISDDTLISPKLIREAQERELPGRHKGRYGLDVARLGRDETCVYRNRGGVIRLEGAWHKQDTMRTAGRAAKIIEETFGSVPMNVDVIGIGAGVYDRINELGYPVHPFNASEKARRPKKFKNRRAEAYWSLREGFEEGLVDLDPADDDLAAQLGAIKYFITSKGQIQIESKEDMAKRGMPSPDRADAVMMSFVAPTNIKAAQLDDEEVTANQTGDLLEKAW